MTMKEKIVRKMRKKENKKKWSILREASGREDVLALQMIPVTKGIRKIKE